MSASKFVVVNGGSSSVKLSLFDPSAKELASSDPLVWTENQDSNLLDSDDNEIRQLFESALKRKGLSAQDVFAVGHRVVHGGADLQKPVLVDSSALKQIEDLKELAPVHNPIAVKLIRAAQQVFSDAKHVAVFDTAFHASLKPESFLYPIPYAWYEKWGLRKFGFHGINHQFCAEKVRAEFADNYYGAKIVVAHLGNGCSMSAVENGTSVDTTMGFTPLEGLMMGARSGSIDPGIIFYLLEEKKLGPQEIENSLNNESGLSGISGLGKDMRKIEKAMAEGNARARLAFEMFVQRVAKYAAEMAAALNGIDTLVFTGGIGEHSSKVRLEVCKRLRFMRLELDEMQNRNATADGVISSPASSVQILKISAREDLQIFREAQKLMKESK